jgi:AraC-like DNA-binding protein
VDEAIQRAVNRVIEAMRDNLGEPLTIDDMARTAMFSKFHFTRIFQQVTGLSPRRFLSAMRLQRAKQLLVSTSLSVTDISHQVGYSSVGTFSSRFTDSVGISPTAYRVLGTPGPSPTVNWRPDRPGASAGVVHGAVCAGPADPVGRVFVALFPERIPRGRPVTHAVLGGPGPYAMDKVPPGAWYLLALAVARGGTEATYVISHGPIVVPAHTAVPLPELRLRPVCALDPPVLPALLDPALPAVR